MALVGGVVLWSVNGVVLLYFLLLNGTYLFTSLLAVRSLRRYARRLKCIDVTRVVESGGAPPVTILAPAYNEELTCVESVRSLLTLNYPDHRIIVVNDGSRDGTRDRLVEAFEMEPASRMPTADLSTRPVRGIYRSRWHPNLWLVDKENGGKADALNAGLSYCETPLFCAIDMDSLVERDALVRVVWPFLEDQRTVAAGGVIRIANGCRVEDGVVWDIRLPRSRLARLQVLEYLRAFLSGRMGWDSMGALLIISGAFGIFRRGPVVEAGGFWTETVGEDMELVVRLHRHCLEEGVPYLIRSIPEAVAWTEVPESFRALGRQRDRWQRGLTESLVRHRPMLLSRRYGRLGTVAYPYFYFLEMMGPAIEVLGYAAFVATVLLGWASLPYVAAFLMLAVAFGIVLSVAAVGLGELTYRRYPRTRDLLHLFWLAFLENFGYRQLNTYWRMRGMVSWLRGRKEWGDMARKGFQASQVGSGLLAAVLLLPGMGAAQDSQDEPSWEAMLSHQRTLFSESELPQWRHDWSESQARIARVFDQGSLSFSVGETARFGREDLHVTGDAYRDLWGEAYGNLRLRWAPGADVSARADLGLELFQPFGGRWEGAVGARHMEFSDGGVQVYSVALAVYHRAWYLRGRTLLTPRAGERALSFLGQVRRFVGDEGDFVEAMAGRGQEIVAVGEGPRVELRDSRILHLRVVRFFHSRFGLEAGVLATRQDQVPSGAGFTLGVLTRW